MEPSAQTAGPAAAASSPPPQEPSADQEKLLRAVYAGNVDQMETLLKNPLVRADYVYPLKGTCLEVACRKPSPRSDKVVQFLLSKVKPNVYEIKPEPIHYAAEYGNHQALRELLRYRPLPPAPVSYILSKKRNNP